MEPLLNIREAAEFLNVSEMTIRRWTNQESLKCYRIGGRKARRFKREDLQAYLESNPHSARSEMVSIGFGELAVPDGAHITHLSKTADEALNVAVAFIADGLAKDETLCIVTPDADSEKIIAAMQQHELNINGIEKAGRLYFSSGMQTPHEQAKYLAQIARSSRSRLRVFGDMTWTKEKRWRSEDLLELEEMVNITPTKNMVFLCQYKLGSFSGEEAMQAIETHSHNIYRGFLKENPYLS